MTTNRRSRPLYRDPDDKMIGGVCSGLGHYFDVDTMLVRVAFVVVAMLGGGGVLAYLILWAALDPAPPGQLGPSGASEPPAIEVASDPVAAYDTIDPAPSATVDGEPPIDPSTIEPSTTDEAP